MPVNWLWYWQNTTFLATRAKHHTAVDFAEQKLAKAKVQSGHVHFHLADITLPWQFATGTYDLITLSLVLEHIERLEPIFEKPSKVLAPGGHVYVGQLHPFKQCTGSKTWF